MSAAVVAQRNSPHMPRSGSRTSSPMDGKRHLVNTEDISKKDPPPQSSRDVDRTTPPRSDPPPNVKPPRDQNDDDNKPPTNAETTLPLAPPPRPAPTQQNIADTPDYFSSIHNSSHFSLEPNPFEQSFGNPSSETPGKSLLPSVAALASPASLLPGANSAGGYNWTNSLRSGPLSPAMLTGPTGSSDYFDGHLRGGFPTPNESSLRSGLTPGGGGSMFPAPSPNSQAIFQHLASGGATPSTLDFHRTAINAAAARKSEHYNHSHPPTSQPTEQAAQTANMGQKPQQQQQTQQDPFGQHDANDAANGLFLLAQARDGSQTNNQFAMPAQPNPSQGLQSNMPQDISPKLSKQPARNAGGSLGGSISGSARGISEMSGEMTDSGNDQAKPNTRGRGKKGSGGKGVQSANGRRKADDTPSKGPAPKKAKGNNNSALMDTSMEGMDSDEEINVKEEQYHENGKKMTDEEKRKNFLERNRVAALKCRQRKKQWLANLQAKVEIFSSENDALSAQVTQMREEIVNLKTLLLAHKDCPVSQAQGISGLAMNSITGDFSHHANPYGMAMQNGQQVMAGQGMQRRYS